MALWLLLIPTILACDMLELPYELSAFVPLTSHTDIEFSNVFLLRDMSWSWEVNTASWLRLSLQPKHASIQVKILQGTNVIFENSADSEGHISVLEEQFSGTYTIQLSHLVAGEETEYQDQINSNECRQPHLYIALALRSRENVRTYDLTNYEKGPPELGHIMQAIQQNSSYEQTDPKRYISTSDFRPGFNTISSSKLRIEIPNESYAGATGLWHVSSSLHFDFLQHGGLTLAIKLPNKKLNWQCVTLGNCFLAVHDDQNSVNLNATLTPGEYELVIAYYLESEYEKSVFQGSDLPFSFHISVEPLIEQEDRFNCDAARLPHDLDDLIEEGYLVFEDLVLCDMFAGEISAEFSLEKRSILRVVTHEPKGIDVDILVLTSSNQVMVESISPQGYEGVLIELDPGRYRIKFNFVNSIINSANFIFCQTFLVQIGITPETYAKQLKKFYQTDQCEENLTTITENLRTMEGILDNQQTYYISISDKEAYKVKIKSEDRDSEVLYTGEFKIPISSYIYFEIHSDFTMYDLVLAVKRKASKSENLIVEEMSESGFERRHIQGFLKPGTYQLMVKTGPTAQFAEVLGHSPSTAHLSFETLPACAVFQLHLQVLSSDAAEMNNWECLDQEVQLLPDSLNTLDFLGLLGAPMATYSSFYSPNLLMPNTNDNNAQHTTHFSLDEPAIIRVRARAGNASQVKASIRSGNKYIINSKVKNEELYITTVVNQHTDYQLVFSYYPIKETHCPKITLLISFQKLSQQGYGKCTTVTVQQDFIAERTLDNLHDGFFKFSLGNGLSSVQEEKEYSFRQLANKAFTVSVPFEIRSNAAIFTAHIQAPLPKSPLAIAILENNEIIKESTISSRNRIDIKPLTLPPGQYTLLIGEFEPVVSEECVRFLGSALIEDESLWDNFEILSKKTQSCQDIDQPENLNLVGQLINGRLHWHKKILMNTSTRITMFSVKIDEISQVRVYVNGAPEIDFTVRLIEADNLSQGTEKSLIFQSTKTLKTRVQQGGYYIEVEYNSPFGLPSMRTCPKFEIDLEIIPENDVEDMGKQFQCSQSNTLPDKLNSVYMVTQTYNTSGPLNHEITLEFDKETIFFFEVTFINSLSGFIWMSLYNESQQKIADSKGLENFSQIVTNVLPGTYKIKLFSGDDTASCFPLRFQYKFEGGQQLDICELGQLPRKLYEENAKPYGKQKKNGKVQFEGSFGVEYADSEHAMFIKAPEKLIIRVMTESNQNEVVITSTLYKNSKMTETLAFSRNQSSSSSFIVELPQQKEDYVLALSFLKGDSFQHCNSYRLVIYADTVESVGTGLECKVETNSTNLPPRQISFYNTTVYREYDDMAIFEEWLLAGTNVPQGVRQSGKLNTTFIYEIELSIANPGVISVIYTQTFIEYDFLTNDISLTFLKDKKKLSDSRWAMIDDSVFNFASVVEGIAVEQGTYILRITQGVASNHLAQMFSGRSVCFPFQFTIEYSTDIEGNQLRLVMPESSNQVSLRKSFEIYLEFDNETQLSPKSLKESAYLKGENGEKAIADRIKINPTEANVVELVYMPETLKARTCYTLVIESLPDDGLTHKYCTLGCQCNPAAQAKCINDICKCPRPYTGDDCYGCEAGYISEDFVCIRATRAEVTSISTRKTTVDEGQSLNFQVLFSLPPYDGSGALLSRQNPGPLPSAFRLKDDKGNFLQASAIFPYSKDLLKWMFEFDAEDLKPGNYKIVVNTEHVLDSNENSFTNFGKELEFVVKTAEILKTQCGVNGVMKNGLCNCNKGATGLHCEECEDGYLKNADGICEETQLQSESQEKQSVAYDSNALVTEVEPVGYNAIPIDKKQIIVKISLSKSPYTSDVLPIDKHSNHDILGSAFVLNKQGTRKVIPPKAVDWFTNTTWELTFDTSKLVAGIRYKLEFLPNILFTKEGKHFDRPHINFPMFVVEDAISSGMASGCSNHGKLSLGKCVCETGYTGVICDKCMPGYSLNEDRACIKQSFELLIPDQSPYDYSWVIYLIGFSCVGAGVIYCIKKAQKDTLEYKYHGVEMSAKEFDSGPAINLKSGRTDRRKPLDDDDDELPLFQ